MLPMLPHDKANHVVYGAAAAAVGCLHSVEAGAIMCLVLGVGKEIYDRVSRKGVPDAMDAVATIAGGAIVCLPVLWYGII